MNGPVQPSRRWPRLRERYAEQPPSRRQAPFPRPSTDMPGAPVPTRTVASPLCPARSAPTRMTPMASLGTCPPKVAPESRHLGRRVRTPRTPRGGEDYWTPDCPLLWWRHRRDIRNALERTSAPILGTRDRPPAFTARNSALLGRCPQPTPSSGPHLPTYTDRLCGTRNIPQERRTIYIARLRLRPTYGLADSFQVNYCAPCWSSLLVQRARQTMVGRQDHRPDVFERQLRGSLFGRSSTDQASTFLSEVHDRRWCRASFVVFADSFRLMFFARFSA